MNRILLGLGFILIGIIGIAIDILLLTFLFKWGKKKIDKIWSKK